MLALTLQMVRNMTVNGKMERKTVMVFMCGLMAPSTMEIGKMAKKMDLVNLLTLMELNMLENIKTVKNTE